MSVYTLASRNSSVEYNVDKLEDEAVSTNAVFAGIIAINGPAFLNGAASFGSTKSGLEVADVNGLPDALWVEGAVSKPNLQWHRTRRHYVNSPAR